jgi:Fur family transcriptional regulator, ferric uptake regulator
MNDESLERVLKRAKLRKTPTRMRVLGVLVAATDTMGAIDILEQLRVHTDSVTLYRTLNSLVKRAVVHRIRGEDRIWRYALSDPEETHARHPHFICDSCGRVECMKEAELPRKLLRQLKVGHQHVVTHAEVILHGTCSQCRQR